jgi:hypothetical protein
MTCRRTAAPARALRRTALVVPLCLGGLLAGPAQSQTVTFKPVSAETLLANPSAFLNQPVELLTQCLPAGAGYLCVTETPLQVAVGRVPPDKMKAFVDRECRELIVDPEAESDCFIRLRFVPTTMSNRNGSYRRKGKDLPASLTVLKAANATFASNWDPSSVERD